MALSTFGRPIRPLAASTWRMRLRYLRLAPLARAAGLLALGASASPALWATEATTTAATERVEVNARPIVAISGFADVPLARAPFQATVLGSGLLADAGATSVSSLADLDASISGAYNSPGYWAGLRVRGYALDVRGNLRRDGLPISGETALLLDNKERVELLKGTSGAQAGTSAPGGLLNLVTKRPRLQDQTQLSLGWAEAGSWKLAADVDRVIDVPSQTGLRLNAALERVDPLAHDADGHRGLLALAGRTQLGPNDRLDAEWEWSRQSQPSLPGFSLLGDRLPDARSIDPRTNLNNQPWSLPVVFEGHTASLRWTHSLPGTWVLSAQVMAQRLRNDDRIAFPFGCSAEDRYDRYCSDGSFDLYDFRSENEQRDTDAFSLNLAGQARTGAWVHQLSTGLLHSRYQSSFQRQAYNYAGTGQIDGSAITPPAPDLTDENTNRDERSLEWSLNDHIQVSERAGLWLGLRHTRLARQSVRTDGSRPTDYDQAFTTPWLAATWQASPATLAYASWGQGVETDVAPNRARYTNAGQPLPALKSRQLEVGLKHEQGPLAWGVAAFDIHRPAVSDLGSCDVDLSCTRQVDGEARHTGLEGQIEARWGDWSLRSSATWLRARRQGGQDASLNGKVPENVPQRSARVQLNWRVPQLAGLQLQASVTHEGPRFVLPDNSIELPSWTTAGLLARYTTRLAGHEVQWRVGVDNLFDRRAWQESPYQYGHAYLYPLAPRTFRTNFQINL